MFDQHSGYSRAVYILLAINSLAGIAFTGAILPQLVPESDFIETVLVTVPVLLINTYFAYRIYKKSGKALKLSAWFYSLQIIGIETDSVAFSLDSGMRILLVWENEGIQFAVNLLAMVTLIVILLALRNVVRNNSYGLEEYS